jgi:hypothetical protein
LLRDTELQAIYLAQGGTLFRRPEDLAWHPLAPRRLILAQTDPSQVALVDRLRRSI